VINKLPCAIAEQGNNIANNNAGNSSLPMVFDKYFLDFDPDKNVRFIEFFKE